MKIKNTIRKPIVSSLKRNILIVNELGCLFRGLTVLFPNKKIKLFFNKLLYNNTTVFLH